MLYLFCNRTYGEAFMAAAARIQSGGLPVRVVLSGRGLRPGDSQLGPLAAPWQMARRLALKLRVQARHGLRATIADNVNAEAFLGTVPAGSVGVVAGFNQIFEGAAIERFATLVNFHPSLLPYYRGPVPSYWCLQRGEVVSGFTLHRVTTAIDAGEILHQEEVPILAQDTAASLDTRIAERAATVLEGYLAALQSRAEWSGTKVDAARLYRNPLNYASFPPREA